MKHKKISQKLILVLVLLILFNFFYPKRVSAWISWEDIAAAPARIIYILEGRNYMGNKCTYGSKQWLI